MKTVAMKERKRGESIALFVSSLCVMLLILPTLGMKRHLALYAMFMLLVMRYPLRWRPLWSLSKSSQFFCVLAFALGVYKFGVKWKYNFSVLLPAFPEQSFSFAIIAGLILAFLGSFFISSLIAELIEPLSQSPTPPNVSKASSNSNPFRKSDIVICLLMAVLVITLCNMCSFLYYTNPWVSPGCYHTVGKSLWSGLLPYRDLYEHKGPLIYALHSLATLFSYRSFIGVYFLLIPFAFFFFYYSRKTIRLFTNKPLDPWFPVVCGGVYALKCYYRGDSAEEMFLPFMAYSLYVAFLYILSGQPFSKSSGVAIGVCVGVVLWTKFNLMVFYLPWFAFLMFDMMRRGCLNHFLLLCKYAFLGLLAVTVPIILFYAIAGALPDLLEVYFGDNLMLYINDQPGGVQMDGDQCFLENLWNNLVGCISDNTVLFVMTILGLCGLLKVSKRCFLLMTLSVLTMVIIVVVRPVVFVYYPFILAVFVPMSVVPLTHITLDSRTLLSPWLSNRIVRYALTGVGACMMIFGSDNLQFTSLRKEDYVQYRFSETILKEKEKDVTLMNYHCQDQGLFAVTGILPSNRFFCDFNIDAPGKHDDQESVVREKLVDFVIMDNPIDSLPGYCVVDSMRSLFYKDGNGEGKMIYLLKRE